MSNKSSLSATTSHQSTSLFSLIDVLNLLRSQDVVVRSFSGVLIAQVLFICFLIFIHPLGLMGILTIPFAIVWTIICLILANIGDVFNYSELAAAQTWRVRIILHVMLAISVGVFFDASNVVNRYRFAQHGETMLYDEVLLRMDYSLLGNFFPKGQLALYLDQHPTLGPQTFIAQCYTEILQIFYTSYYFWGNALSAFLAFLFYLTVSGRINKYVLSSSVSSSMSSSSSSSSATNNSTLSSSIQYRRMQLYISAWTGAFLFNFALNVMIPAVSPRIYLQTDYKNEIRGLVIADILRAAVKSAASNTFSAFPSGHCGLSWLAAFLAYRLGFITYARITAIAGLLITCATVVLRYHYFVDMLAATVVFMFGIFFVAMESATSYQTALFYTYRKDNQEDIELDNGKPHSSSV